jgi:hypothetical protein
MPAIVYKTFSGEIPKESPSLLPQHNAQLSTNCDFSDGTLRALNAGALELTLASNPVKGLYTEDGLTYYSWPVETLTFRSPIISDAYSRMYYLSPSVGDFNVTTKAAMSLLGPTPLAAAVFKAGVPRPTVAPTVRLVNRTTLPDYPAITVAATAWWDYGGSNYSDGAVTLTQVTALKRYTFPAPALPGSPPENVTPTLVVKLLITDNNNSNATIVSITARAASSGRSNALPGSVEAALSLADGGTATIDLTWGIADTIAYAYTYENTWNEESAPSPPTVVSRTYLQDVEVTATAGVFTGYRPFSQYNLYRTYGTNLNYFKCVSGATTVNIDTLRTPPSIGSVLESVDYFPPVAGLEGAALSPGGWFVGFKDSTLYKSAPYKPHAWPYSEKFPTDIRGVCVGQQAIIVTCADGVYLVPGNAPSRSGYIKLSAPQAGIAQRSMANVDGAVAYASNDGLVLVTGSVASIEASQKLFNRKTWRDRYGTILSDYSLRLAYQDGFIIGSSNTTASGFLVRLDEDVGAFTRTAVAYDTMFQLPVNDALYYTVGSNVYRWQGGAALTFDWWGKEWVFPYECTMGAGYIKTTGTIAVKIYADGVECYSQSLTTGFFRIGEDGGGRRARQWSIRLGGTGTVHEIAIAQSMVELKRVP